MQVKSILKPINVLAAVNGNSSLLQDHELLMVCNRAFDTGGPKEEQLKIIEEVLGSISTDRSSHKRFFYIIVEAIQNVFRHQNEEGRSKVESLFIIGRHKSEPYIMTANPVSSEQVPELEDRLQHLASLSNEQLKDLYRNKLTSGERSAAGGGNLGLIEIARKSGNTLEYGFEKVDDDVSYFVLRIQLAR